MQSLIHLYREVRKEIYLFKIIFNTLSSLKKCSLFKKKNVYNIML